MYGTSPPKIYTLSLTTLFRSRVSVTTDVTYELTRSRSPTAGAWRRPGILQVSGPTATPFREASIGEREGAGTGRRLKGGGPGGGRKHDVGREQVGMPDTYNVPRHRCRRWPREHT